MKTSFYSFLFYSCIYLIYYQAFTPILQAQNTSKTTYYRQLILNPQSALDVAEAYSYFSKTKEKHLQNGDTLNAVHDLRLISIALKNKGLLQESETYAIEALQLIAQKTKHKEPLIGLYNHLGIVNTELERYNIAINYYEKVIAIAPNQSHRHTAIKNLAMVYSKMGHYHKAITLFNSVLEHKNANTDLLKQARLLSNIGFAQSKINHPEAYSNLSKALDIHLKKNYNSGIITSYLHLAEHYKDKAQRTQALAFANKALRLARALRNKHFELHILDFKTSLNTDVDIITYKHLNDSVQKANTLFKNQFASSKYEFDKEKGRADRNAILREKEKTKKQFFQLLSLIGLMLTVFIVIRLKDKHNKEKALEIFNTESRISKKVHDDVANDIYQVMTNLQHETVINTKNIQTQIEQIYVKARDISKQFNDIDVSTDFLTTLKDLALSYNSDQTSIILRGVTKISWDNISKVKKTALYKVLQELLINMKKHSNASVAVIVFSSHSKKINISYSDDGIGCSNLTKSNGLQNVENRIKAIKGTITFESRSFKGFKSKITI